MCPCLSPRLSLSLLLSSLSLSLSLSLSNSLSVSLSPLLSFSLSVCLSLSLSVCPHSIILCMWCPSQLRVAICSSSGFTLSRLQRISLFFDAPAPAPAPSPSPEAAARTSGVIWAVRQLYLPALLGECVGQLCLPLSVDAYDWPALSALQY